MLVPPKNVQIWTGMEGNSMRAPLGAMSNALHPWICSVKNFLASVSSGIHAMCPNREKQCAWTIAEKCGCLVAISLHHSTHHLIPSSFHRQH